MTNRRLPRRPFRNLLPCNRSRYRRSKPGHLPRQHRRQGLLSDETYYVATKEESLVTFKLPKAAEVAFVIDIDNQVPLDIVIWPSALTETQYTNMKVSIGMSQMGDVLRTISGDNSKPGEKFTEAELFFHPQSKRGAHGHRETTWFPYDAGTSTIVLDNSGDFTTTRGDAPVRVQIWTRTLPK